MAALSDSLTVALLRELGAVPADRRDSFGLASARARSLRSKRS